MSTNSRSAETPRPLRTRLHAGHLALALIVALPSCGGDGDGGSGPAAAWSLGTTETVTAVANEGEGDSSIVVRCPDGSVGVGYEGRHGDFMDQIRLLCAELRADGTLGALATSEKIGTSTAGNEFSTECAPDSMALTVLVGANGEYARDAIFQGGPIPTFIRIIRKSQGQCLRPADVAAGVANDASVRATATLGGDGGTLLGRYTTFCPHGSAVTGLKGEENTETGRLAAIGLICREVRDG